MAEPGTIPAPTVVSLLLCDQVIDDKLTNKKSAIGLFNTVLFPAFPASIPQLVVMASLTEITGRTQLELRLVRDADNSVLFATNGFVEAPNPLVTVDLVFAMQGVRIPAPGQYAFELLTSGAILGRRRFQAVLPRRPAPGPGGSPPTGQPSEPLDPPPAPN